MKKSLLLIFTMIFSIASWSQSVNSWIVEHSNFLEDFTVYDSEYCNDGGQVLTGGSADKRIFIAKVDSAGEMVWLKKYYTIQTPTGTKDSEIGKGIVQTDDGGFLMAAKTTKDMNFVYPNGYKYIILVKTDASGNTEWTKMLGTPQAGSLNDTYPDCKQGEINDLEVLGADQYALSGLMGDSTTGNTYGSLVIVDGLGNIIESKRVHGYEISDLELTDDGGFVMSANPSFIFNITVKLDASFNYVWDNGFAVGSGFNLSNNIATKDGQVTSLFSFGTSGDYTVGLYKFDNSTGAVLDAIEVPNLDASFTEVIELDTNVFMVFGSDESAKECVALKINLNNRSVYKYVYDNFLFGSVIESSDGFILSGSTGVGPIKQLKLDSDGAMNCMKSYELLCSSSPLTLGAFAPGTTVSDYPHYELAHTVSEESVLMISNKSCESMGVSGNLFKIDYQLGSEASGVEVIEDACASSDGGIIVVGGTDSFGQGLSDGLINSYAHDGEIKWSTTIGTSDNEVITSISTTSGCGYIIAGEITNTNEVLIAEIDNGGTVIWINKYSTTASWKIHEIMQSSTGDIVITGVVENSNMPVLGKFDATGNVQWVKRTGNNATDGHVYLTEASDGNYIYSMALNSSDKLNYGAFTPAGVYSWASTISGIVNTAGPIAVNEGGELILSGTNLDNASQFILKCADDGSTFGASLDENHFEIGLVESPLSMHYDGTGAIYISGYLKDSVSFDNDLYLVKLNHDFDVQWVKSYGGNGDEYGGFVVPSSFDDGVFISGYSNSLSGNEDSYLIKTDAEGFAGNCMNGPLGYSIVSNTTTVGTASTFTSTAYTITTTAYLSVQQWNSFSNSYVELDVLADVSNVSCFAYNDGEIDLSYSGGVSPYNVQWEGFGSVEDLSNLAPGPYNYKVEDARGCGIYDTIIITEPVALQSSATAFDVLCEGGYDGWAYVTASGGTQPYNYYWSNGYVSDTSFNMLSGFYTVNVLDSNGCTGLAVVNIQEPLTLTYSLGGVDNTCNGDATGMAYVNLSNGTTPYTYSWSNGGTTDTITNQVSGNYTFVAHDACGDSIIDSVLISEPVALTAQVTESHVACFGGTDGNANVFGANGTAPYNYYWYDDASTGNSIGNQIAGSDSVLIVDACGAQLVLTYLINEPSQLTTTIVGTDVTCYGYGDGTITVSPSGGPGPYLYSWNSGQNQATVAGLFANTYSVNVTDANGCLASNFMVINEPTSVQLSFGIQDATCGESNGEISASATGGSSPYNYVWVHGDLTADIAGYAEGFYSLTVNDVNGCFFTDSAFIGISINPIELCMITVDTTSSYNLLVWEKPVVGNIEGFKLYRNIGGVYSQIGYQPYDSISQYADNSFGIDPSITSYRYEISVLDTCGNESTLSNYHETIHLTVNMGLGGEANLIWDDYEGISFSQYYIMRDSTGDGTWDLIDSVGVGSFTYSDLNPPGSENLAYMVQIDLPFTCTAEKSQDHNTTRSNRHTVVGGSDGVGIEIELDNLFLEVFPNPSTGVFNIHTNSDEQFNYSVFSIAGELISQGVFEDDQNILNLEEFERGVYLLKVEGHSTTLMKRLVKQ